MSDALLEDLMLLGGFLVAVTTGLEIRTVDRSLGRTSVAQYFPQLTIGVALVSGLALAGLAVIVLVGWWPLFARFLAGPLAAVYGLGWFHTALIEASLDAQARPEEALRRHRDRCLTEGLSLAVVQVGFGAQMGVLLCAVGARRPLEFVAGAILALCAATEGITARLDRMLRPLDPYRALQCLTGALLFGLAVGTIIRDATKDGTSQGFATLLVAAVLWVVGLTLMVRIARRCECLHDGPDGASS